MGLQLALKPLRCLRQPKADTQVYKQHRHPKARVESFTRCLERALPHAPNEQSKQRNKHQKSDCLENQTRQQDVVGVRRIASIRVRNAYHRGTHDLDHRRDDITRDEDPEDELWAQRRGTFAVGRGADQDREHGVDGGCEEDGCDDDEEVLDDEVGDLVGVAFRGEGAGDIADEFLRWS